MCFEHALAPVLTREAQSHAISACLIKITKLRRPYRRRKVSVGRRDEPALSHFARNTSCVRGTMLRAERRIAVTHVGSLIRPPGLIAYLEKIRDSETYDP